jgi:hypothetical protein
MSIRTSLQVDRHTVTEARLVEEAAGSLADDHVRCEVEYVALTANTFTYAQFGDMLAYWDFYPVSADWGLVPAMGYGRVTESNVAGIDVGTRLYGWWPMSTSVDIQARPTASGFRDDGAHRAPHAAVYREFTATDRDPLATDPDDEQRHPLLRGLFVTGFLADAFFAADGYLGAEQAIVLSASSKTALGYAAAARRTGSVRLIGVTSAANEAFVAATGLYDRIVTYDDLGAIPSATSVVVDMAGNGAAIAAIHAALRDDIRSSMVIGKSHHDAAPAAVEHGPTPQMFFAPGAVADRLAEWGAEEYQRRIRDGLAAFVRHSHDWLHLDLRHGPDAFAAAWTELGNGSVAPSTGLLATMHRS